MKTKGIRVLIILLLAFTEAIAQRENNIWAFGSGLGIDFNSGAPVLINTATSTNEGCSAICDPGGALLFHSNGLSVWDRNNTRMPNGGGLGGNFSSTMGVAITPLQSDSNLYFLFTVDAYAEPRKGRIRYSLIDMRLNGGNGDIVAGVKNIALPDSNMSEKMLVVPSCDGVWLITHHCDSSIFYAYKISSTTIPEPIVSRTDTRRKKDYYTVGEMKMSPDLSRLALSNFTIYPPEPKKKLELVNFDRFTGVFSGSVDIDSFQGLYSVAFSPDGSKLYAVEYSLAAYQYDLNLLPDLKAVHTSKYQLNGTYYVSAALAPDNKIYLVRNFGERICRLSEPNKAGAACMEELSVAPFKTVIGSFLIFHNNTARPGTGLSTPITGRKDTIMCEGSAYHFTAPKGRTNYRWNDGNTNPDRDFDRPGLYWLESVSDCYNYSDTLNILFHQPGSSFHLALDTVICFVPELTVAAPTLDSEYLWNDGSRDRKKVLNQNGTYWVRSGDNQCNYRVDTFRVQFQNAGSATESNCMDCIRIPNAFTPNRDGKNDVFKPIIFCETLRYQLLIVNRFGEVVFETSNPKTGWDASYKNREEDLGVYYYLIRVLFNKPQLKEEIIKGDITLIR